MPVGYQRMSGAKQAFGILAAFSDLRETPNDSVVYIPSLIYKQYLQLLRKKFSAFSWSSEALRSIPDLFFPTIKCLVV